MSDKINDVFVAYTEKSQQCDDCGEIEELRPYGPPGKTMICFSCAMKDPKATEERFRQILG